MSNRFTFKNLNLKEDNLGIQRTRLSFGPKYGLSIIKEPNKTYYEIGALVNNELTELSGITAHGDTVQAGLSPDDINTIIVKMQTISASEPKEENV